MHLIGMSESDIIAALSLQYPEIPDVLEFAQGAVPWSKRQIWPFEAAALYALGKPLDRLGGQVLEIGTALGYSAAILAQAMPKSRILTLNPKPGEYDRAVGNLAVWPKVTVRQEWSANALGHYHAPPLDLVFVDGDHCLEAVRIDCGWWQHVRRDDLMLFHDYTPTGKRVTPGVVQAVDEFGTRLGRSPDVLVRGDRGTGMAGWYKREGEQWIFP